jgi:integrase
MVRPRKPARLWQRSDGAWLILDEGRQYRLDGATGERDRAAAEAALAGHIARKVPQRVGPAQPSDITVGEILARYITDNGADMAAPERLAYAAKRLGEYWAEQTCDAVKGSTCRAYLKHRQKPVYVPFRGGKKGRMVSASEPTVRRELNVLQAALNYGLSEGLLIYAPRVTLPDKGSARERWLTRDEAARLLWAARRSRNKSLARVILIGLYTGTRIGAILRLRWVHSLDSGWIDVDRGILHRRGRSEKETKKRRGDCRLPRQLLGHVRRWREGEHVVTWAGNPINDITTGFKAACMLAKLDGVTPHTLKHTAVTWAFQRGMSLEDASGYFSTSAKTLEDVYRQHHPDYQGRVVKAMESK